jgi:hypothetical protein
MKVGTSAGFIGLRATSGATAMTRDSLAGDTQAPAPSLAQQINDWRQVQAKALTSASSGSSQAALEKAGMLRQRLEMLKAMLLFASPEMARSIAAQLKGIASQLAALGKSVGAATASGALPTASAAAVGATGASVAAADPPVDSDAAQGEASAAAAPDESLPDAKSDSQSDSRSNSPDDPAAQDKALRKTLQDARALLKVLIERVKAKLRQGERDARLELESARKDLAELDQALATPQAGLYTAQGGEPAVSTALSPSSAGARVDLRV